MPRGDRKFLYRVVLVAALLRLVFVLWYPQVPAGIGDDRTYEQVALNLVAGKGFSGGLSSGQWERTGQPAPLDVPGDPEIGFGQAESTGGQTQGLFRGYSYPVARQLTFGIDLTF